MFEFIGKSFGRVKKALNIQCMKFISGLSLDNKRGMELVQVAILIAIAIVLGIVFRTQTKKFIKMVFNNLNSNFGS